MTSAQSKIIVVGAGIAGLAAAHKLVADGFEVMVLEARDCIGGRIRTDYSLGLPLNLGAGWLHGLDHNPIVKLAADAKIPYQLSEFSNTLFFDHSQTVIPSTEIINFFHEQEFYLAHASKIAQSMGNDLSLAAALDLVKPQNSTMRWRDMWNWALIYLELYTGADIRKISARYWDEEQIFNGGNYLVTGSYVSILQGLAKDIDIKFNTHVTKINFENKNIKITTDKGEWEAEKVIVTLPLGVLQSGEVRFEPALKEFDFSHLAMGLLNRIILKFPTIFWPTQHQNFFSAPQQYPFVSSFINLQHYVNQPLLMGMVGGDNALQLELLPDNEIIALAMKELRKMFGNNIPESEMHLITRWGQDPYSYGSYSYVPYSCEGAEYDRFTKPIENRLFFAGEATNHEHPATTHGAYLSGIREAEHIINLR